MRKHRDKDMFTSESWIEGNTITISRYKAYSRGTMRHHKWKDYKRKVKYNRSDGLYFLLDNMKYFEYEFEPCD